VLERLVPSEAEDKSALSKSSSTTKKFLMAIAWTANDGESKGNKAAVVDTSTWELDATTADELAAQLREHVVSSGAAVADLVELFNWQETGEAKRAQSGVHARAHRALNGSADRCLRPRRHASRLLRHR
jgi:hypothetical protein